MNKLRVFYCIILVSANVIQPMMTGMRKLNGLNRVGSQSLGAIQQGVFNNTVFSQDQLVPPVTPLSTNTPVVSLPKIPSLQPEESAIINQKVISKTKTVPDIHVDVHSSQKSVGSYPHQLNKSTIAIKGPARAIYGQPFSNQQHNKVMQLLQKRDFSSRALQDVLQTMSPKFKRYYNLEDDIHGPDWYFLFFDGHAGIVKALLQDNLVKERDKLKLLENAIRFCKLQDLSDILKFYTNNIDTVSEVFERYIDYTYVIYTNNMVQLSYIHEFIQAGISQDVKIKTGISLIHKGDYIGAKLLYPEWFKNEMKHQRKIMLSAQDITQTQKNMLQALYDTAIWNENQEAYAYYLTDEQMEEVVSSALSLSQIKKYLPRQLFDTPRFFEMRHASLTAQFLLRADPYIAPTFHDATSVEEYNTTEQFLWNNNLYDKIIEVEKEQAKEGYHTFVHGRSWRFNFTQDIYNLIRALKAGDDHMQPVVELLQGSNETGRQSKYLRHENSFTTRQQILEQGAGCPSDGICLNATMFDNRKSKPLHSPSYVRHNYNSAFTGHKVTDIFEQFDMQKSYKKYQDKFEQLEKLHKQSSQHGELLAVSIKKDKIDSLTYFATFGAAKVDYIPGVRECKPSVMLEKLYQKAKTNIRSSIAHDENYYYYLAMPGLPGENGTDYKVVSIHVADPQAYAQYKYELSVLFEQMKQEPEIASHNRSMLLDTYCSEFFKFHQQEFLYAQPELEEID